MTRTQGDWLKQAFDHPVTSPAWFFKPDAATWDASAGTKADLIAEAFEQADNSLAGYSDEQVAQGLKYIADPSCGNTMASVLEANLAREQEARLIRSFVALFDKCLARRCKPVLSSVAGKEADALNLACYMWWDTFPWYGRPSEPRFKARDGEILTALEQTLRIPQDACREAALHGLGHWQRHYPARVERIIDDFLADESDVQPDLRRYAASARSGRVN